MKKAIILTSLMFTMAFAALASENEVDNNLTDHSV